MGKFNLGNSVTKISNNIDKNSLYLNQDKMQEIVDDMEKQFDELRDSLFNINTLLNKCVSRKIVSGNAVLVFKGWARKCNSQALASENRKNSLLNKYKEDINKYKIQQLEARIEALEEKLLSVKE